RLPVANGQEVTMLRKSATFSFFLAIADLRDRKSTRLNSSHVEISYAVFCLKKKKISLPRDAPVQLLTGAPVTHVPGAARDLLSSALGGPYEELPQVVLADRPHALRRCAPGD